MSTKKVIQITVLIVIIVLVHRYYKDFDFGSFLVWETIPQPVVVKEQLLVKSGEWTGFETDGSKESFEILPEKLGVSWYAVTNCNFNFPILISNSNRDHQFGNKINTIHITLAQAGEAGFVLKRYIKRRN